MVWTWWYSLRILVGSVTWPNPIWLTPSILLVAMWIPSLPAGHSRQLVGQRLRLQSTLASLQPLTWVNIASAAHQACFEPFWLPNVKQFQPTLDRVTTRPFPVPSPHNSPFTSRSNVPSCWVTTWSMVVLNPTLIHSSNYYKIRQRFRIALWFRNYKFDWKCIDRSWVPIYLNCIDELGLGWSTYRLTPSYIDAYTRVLMTYLSKGYLPCWKYYFMVFLKIKVKSCILIHPIDIYKIWGELFLKTLLYLHFQNKIERILQFEQHVKIFLPACR